MSKINRGKDWERIVKESLEEVGAIVRIPDQTSGFKVSSQNFCDFIFYNKPNIAFIECKSIYGNTFSFSRVTLNQMQGLLKYGETPGAFAGVLVWFVEHAKVMVMSAKAIDGILKTGVKSFNLVRQTAALTQAELVANGIYILDAQQKRTLINIDGEKLLEAMRQGL